MKLIYIWDALCGWCYGFGAVLEPFVKNHPELDFQVISGGLFDAGKTLADYPHIPGANEQIQGIYKVEIGQAYQDVLEDGSLVLNSYHPAAGFGVLREMIKSDQLIDLTIKLQQAFYIDGKSLSDIETYRDLAEALGVDSDLAVDRIQAAFNQEDQHHPDFDEARSFGVQSYPTLILEKDGKYYDVRGKSMTLAGLEKNFELLKNLED